MPLATPSVWTNGVMDRRLAPGDLLAGGESISAGAISTAGAGTWTGAAIATGIIRRTGPVGGYTDTLDTAANIITALGGNTSPDCKPGSTFRLLFINTVAQAQTLAAAAGITLGVGTTGVAASLWREYLFTIINPGPVFTAVGTTVTSSTTIAFALPTGMVALPIGPSPLADNLTPGMTVTGTGIATATTIASVTQGQGGITGVVLSGTATASAVVPLTFGPTMTVDGLRSGTL